MLLQLQSVSAPQASAAAGQIRERIIHPSDKLWAMIVVRIDADVNDRGAVGRF